VIPGLTPTEVTTELKLNELKGRTWFVVPSCATTGEGLMEGLVCFLEFPQALVTSLDRIANSP
jgi:hypothetical protein